MTYREDLPLSEEQRLALQKVKDDGHMTGVSSVYWHLIDVMGDDAPTKKHVSDFMRTVPEVQVSRMNRKVEGVKNSGGPIIPEAVPLSYMAADTLFLPASYHTDKRVYKAAILYVCALTKYVYVHPCSLGRKDRPMSTTARDGFIEFLMRVRRIAGNDDMHPRRIRTDNGSEFVGGACRQWLNQMRTKHTDFYEYTTTTGSRSAGNPFAERAIQSWKRLLYTQYRAVEREWDENSIDKRKRRFNWLPYCDLVTERYNTRRHSTIKAKPIDAIAGNPSYSDTRKRIAQSAKKAYGDLEVDRSQPAFSSKANRVLSPGDLVRTLIIKKGPHLSTWNAAKSNTVSAGENWSKEVFIVARVHVAQTYGNSTYVIAERGPNGQLGSEKKGVWTRQQLQHIPPETALPDVEPDDGDDDDDDDDDDQEAGQFVDAATAHPRPPIRGNWRYKKGDVLMFRKPYFMEDDDGAVGGLEAPALRRDRTGVILQRTRLRPRARQKGAFLYTVLFDDPSTKVPSLPAHGDDGIDEDENVEFLNDAAA